MLPVPRFLEWCHFVPLRPRKKRVAVKSFIIVLTVFWRFRYKQAFYSGNGEVNITGRKETRVVAPRAVSTTTIINR
jgi:hypothetical protein